MKKVGTELTERVVVFQKFDRDESRFKHHIERFKMKNGDILAYCGKTVTGELRYYLEPYRFISIDTSMMCKGCLKNVRGKYEKEKMPDL